MTGSVLQLSIKPRTPGAHGLPKHAVPRIEVATAGVMGDHNHWRTENLPTDVDQAVLVVTDEVLAQLRSEGWPVQPGHLGENVTLTGIPEAALGPGARLEFGGVLLEVSQACDPCTRLHSLPYVGKERGQDFVRTMVGRRGWYARVIRPGVIEQGGPVEVAPRPPAASAAP